MDIKFRTEGFEYCLNKVFADDSRRLDLPNAGVLTVAHTVDDRNPASPYLHLDVPYYHNPNTFGKGGLHKVMQDFYHKQDDR